MYQTQGSGEAPDRPGTTILGETLLALMREDDRVVALDADLCTASGLQLIRDTLPARFVECGISEANMVGVAAGMAAAGMIPFTHTFAAFAARKCLDQVFLAAGFNGRNVKLIGTDPGIQASKNGATHQGLEDMGALMGIPGITLVEPSDATMLERLLRQARDLPGVVYLRVFRKESVDLYGPGEEFEIGRGKILREGGDVTLIASGIEVAEALEAARLLAADGIGARVVDLFTWKPLDRPLIADCARRTGAIVTAENHQLANGLGHAVAAVVAEECPVPMAFVGVRDRFGEVGDVRFLMEKLGLAAGDIAAQARAVMGRKGSAIAAGRLPGDGTARHRGAA